MNEIPLTTSEQAAAVLAGSLLLNRRDPGPFRVAAAHDGDARPGQALTHIGVAVPVAQVARNRLFDVANEVRLNGGVIAYWADVIEEIADELFPTVIFGPPIIHCPGVSSMAP